MSHNTTAFTPSIFISIFAIWQLVSEDKFVFASEWSKPYQVSFDSMLLAYAADEKYKLMIASGVSMRLGY